MNTLFILSIQPGLLLLSGLIIIAILAWILWPQKGGLARFSRMKARSQRELLEDSLKYMFDCEYRKAPCDMHSIAGNLDISVDRASLLLEHLFSKELITLDDQAVSLSDTGRSYALRVIRVHRIWERYFADETSIDQADWHNEACRIEHNVTMEDTEKLAAQMGHPVFDPHGDPIPTAEGTLPEPTGVTLNHLKEGQLGRVTHMEDEPKSIYEQLVVLGLYPGMQIYITDVAENKISFVADGDECSLTPLFAAHITVELVSAKEPVVSKNELLSSLQVGEEAEVVAISPNCRGQQRRRLMDMGIVPGSLVSAVIKSASGDPVGYRVLGTTVGIRSREADLIFINRKK
ncbi:metal-dependent transcriptional regulator [Mangrovibacterium lignilyticum]|uniref:metal-dependent transcriptional regulator n=1 Tax=Mangrovibacterium lignilyticum TaxID=2668052 RepID=UPI0013D6EA50|nr:DtxR family transcriptional regulator [Mangrovibacterium lignilyticum]